MAWTGTPKPGRCPDPGLVPSSLEGALQPGPGPAPTSLEGALQPGPGLAPTSLESALEPGGRLKTSRVLQLLGTSQNEEGGSEFGERFKSRMTPQSLRRISKPGGRLKA